MKTEFFMALEPPTVTHQEKKVRVVGGKPIFYEPEELKAARQKLISYLSQHVPAHPYTEKVRLTVLWYFKGSAKNNGAYRTTKPDLDNLMKLLQDCMTTCKFWIDDAQIVGLMTEKKWGLQSGIYIRIEDDF
ncbi:MAG: RusA family crossover junction endodeoxyribonuclease [Dorea sp.]|nr:RusA family crossover junction endodeoxyribonuclease [Dorea sp.]